MFSTLGSNIAKKCILMDFRVYMAKFGDCTPTLGRTIGERFFGTFYASCIILFLLNRIIAFLQDKVRNGDSSPWWSSLLRWAQAPSTSLLLMMGTVLHACWAKPFFQELHAGGIVSVADAHSYVLQFQAALHSWALDPKLALQFEGKGRAVVQTHSLLAILLRRLRIVFPVMSERWDKYIIAYRNGGPLDPTCSTHLCALKATPCTSIFEESFFGAFSNQWTLMGPTAAAWRVTATAINRANASVDMPLLEEDVPQLIQRAARVEEIDGKFVKNFRIQPAKRKHYDI